MGTDTTKRWLRLIIVFFTYVFIGLFYLLSYSSTRDFIIKWWWLLIPGSVFFILALIALIFTTRFEQVRTLLVAITAIGRVKIVIGVVIPSILLLVGAVVFLQPSYQVSAIRFIFFLSVCLFPATMYYLFISTRKYSLLNEFIINLDRLGLLDYESSSESCVKRRHRINTYLQKFQGVYGPLSPNLLADLDELLKLKSTDEEVCTSKHFTAKITSNHSSLEVFTPETSVPVVLATVLIAVGWITILPPWQVSESIQNLEIFAPQQTAVHFAFLGAYFFSVQMLFRRYARRDLRASAYVAVSLRIILAVIGTWVVISLLPVDYSHLPVFGFVIGVFPHMAWQIVQTFMKNTASIVIPSFRTPLPLSELDGLTVWNETRLEEEDIENIPNMATVDIVDLLLSTRISSDRVIDWIDQAILYTHLGPKNEMRDELHFYGIRNASSLINICQNSSSSDEDVFVKNLRNIKTSQIHPLIDSIKNNPNIKLIQKWKCRPSQFDENINTEQ